MLHRGDVLIFRSSFGAYPERDGAAVTVEQRRDIPGRGSIYLVSTDGGDAMLAVESELMPPVWAPRPSERNKEPT